MMAMKKEEEIRRDATLANAEKMKLIASTMSQLKSQKGEEQGEVSNKRTAKERDQGYVDKAHKERNELRAQRKREIERERRLEVAGKKTEKD